MASTAPAAASATCSQLSTTTTPPLSSGEPSTTSNAVNPRSAAIAPVTASPRLHPAELDEPTLGCAAVERGACGPSQRGLPDPARPDDRHQATAGPDPSDDVRQLVLAADRLHPGEPTGTARRRRSKRRRVPEVHRAGRGPTSARRRSHRSGQRVGDGGDVLMIGAAAAADDDRPGSRPRSRRYCSASSAGSPRSRSAAWSSSAWLIDDAFARTAPIRPTHAPPAARRHRSGWDERS